MTWTAINGVMAAAQTYIIFASQGKFARYYNSLQQGKEPEPVENTDAVYVVEEEAALEYNDPAPPTAADAQEDEKEEAQPEPEPAPASNGGWGGGWNLM